jgi:outer membrane protein, multidrug efflux system
MLAAAAVLAACAGAPTTPNTASADTPAQWQAPLPHGGELAALGQWWRQFDDPLLVQLIDAAQSASATVASAQSRIEQARATRVAAGAALLPALDASANASRGRQDLFSPLATSATAGVQASWEIDVFGGRRAAKSAAEQRLAGAQAGWHDARVAVAAETATSYTALRACEAQAEQQRADTDSRAQSARLTELSAKAGFEAPASAALARASAAQANSLLTQRRAQCASLVKALVALTALPEPALRAQLSGSTARVPQPAQLSVPAVPAQALAQRPDVFIAERDLLAASADVAQARAQRWPSIRLGGSVGVLRIDSGASSGGSDTGSVWSIGPVSVALPLFDGGTRRANVDAAQARVDESAALYRARLRIAVREVEDALVMLQSTADRAADARTASEGFAASLRATQARFSGGLASLFELEDARRSAVQAQVALIDLQRERSTAWIDLYRALGGGWSAADVALATRP